MDNEQWIMDNEQRTMRVVMLSEAKHLKRFFAALRMTKGNDF